MSFVTVKQPGLSIAAPEHTIRSIVYEELVGNEAIVRILRMGELPPLSFKGHKKQVLQAYNEIIGSKGPEVIQVTETQAVRRNEISSVNAYDAEPVLKFKDRLVVGTRTGERHLVEFDTREQRDAEAKRIIREWRGV
jgi:hypothetical protein